MLKRRAVVATLWSGGDVVLRQGMQFVVTLILARILSPADFGVIAMLALFIGLAGLLTDAGLSLALIQSREVSHMDESTVFWSNLGIGLALSCVLFAAAPSIAGFYGVPMLQPLMRVLAVMPLLSASSAVHTALLTKKLDFRTQASAGFTAAMVSGAIAIAIAMSGGGVWALAAQALSMAAINSLLLWILHSWRPMIAFSHQSLRNHGRFGGYALASNISEMAYSRLYTLVAGRLFGAIPLGYYSNAENTRQLPANFLGNVVARVALPMLSHAGNDLVLARRGVQLSIRVMMLVNAPIMLAIAALAEPIVQMLYGSAWLPSAPLLQVLALAGLLYPLHLINVQALLAMGQARLVFRLEVVKKAIGMALLLLGARFGLLGIAWSQVVFSIVALGINAHYTKIWFCYGAFAQVRDAATPVIVAALIALVANLIFDSFEGKTLVWLLIIGSVCCAIYLVVVWRLRIRAWGEVTQLIRQSKDL